jgi:hypothetical protein
MKYITSILVCLLIFTNLSTFTAKAEDTTYDYTQTYDGRFQSDRLFQRDERKPIWRPNPGSPQLISEITCDDALDALHETGIWTGNLSDEGECLGSAEAMERTTGNYLNYLHQNMTTTSVPND